jgi:HAMP domain-containing protein
MQLKVNAGAPFRLGVRLTNSQEHGPAEEVARRAPVGRRRVSDMKLEAAQGKRREESAPPTKPSIAPPTAAAFDAAEPLGAESPLGQLERAAPTLTYGLVVALAALALGVGASMTAWWRGQEVSWLASSLWFLAISTLLFSLSMALWITLSFTRRLRALADAAERLAYSKSEPLPLTPRRDAVMSLAQSVTKMSDRITRLTAEIEQCVEEEQARVDELVRERTRSLARESDDLRRVLGESKGLLSIDRDGRIVGSVSSALTAWLGAAPRAAHFWEYFERASSGSGSRFESAWAGVSRDVPGEATWKRLPKSLAVRGRYFALEYKPVQDAGGNLERVLVLVSDITIPDPDPATPS